MKLTFNISYRTAWGESLHVCIAYHSQDGTVRHQNIVMLTDDGDTWTLDTASLFSRRHPLSHISYFYQVENADGDVLRTEWHDVERIYHFDATNDYLFIDQWRDRPLAYHLYSNAYRVSRNLPLEEKAVPLQLPLYRRTLLLRVSAPQLLPGQSVAICGSHPAIGSWNPTRYLTMHYAGQGEWLLSVNAMGFQLPIEYKYVVIDSSTNELLHWEEGDNRVIDENQWTLNDGQVRVIHGGHLRMAEQPWRMAGVAVPVFSLRSEHSYGVGDFGDLKLLINWARQTGMHVVQLLPVNDTTTDGRWHDSYPYNIISTRALHPHYIDLEAAGTLRSKQAMTQFRRRKQELNALPYSDYEAVHRVKKEYLKTLFDEQFTSISATEAYRSFVEASSEWLKPYADFLQDAFDYVTFEQFLLHQQLSEAASYARANSIVLMGDLPIGVNRDSVETRQYPELFHLDMQTGAPPDQFSRQGQNWGFPTYNWGDALHNWFSKRILYNQQYFDAIRIDHVLGFFRIWEIPIEATDGLLGHFSPALPLTVAEIEYFGLKFHKDLFTKPFVNDKIINQLFGIHADYARQHFFVRGPYDFYDLQPAYDTQRKVETAFADRHDESSIWIKQALMRILTNVLFVEDPRQPEMYHPRIGAMSESVYMALSAEDKDAYARLYNNYFYQRHSIFWGQTALKRLPAILTDQQMLVCAEDLGMLPDCVAPVLDQLRILTLEIQQMPKQQGFEFAHLDGNPIRSLCTTSTHDMAPLRLWWQENPEQRQRYYVSMLQKEGRAPEQLPAHIAEEIVARHLYCPSMLCVLPLQDWLAMDSELRRKNPQEERVNVPSDAYNRWQYRMHITIEQLIGAQRFNSKLKTMISRSKR
mgnify:FL=1